MPKPWYSIKAAAAKDEVVEVSIFDAINKWYGVSAQTFLADLKAKAKDAKSVKVLVNSPGGDVFEALTIFNGLRMLGKTVEVHVMGIAASAASYIAMAGSKVVMPKNTSMLPHKPMNGVFGNADEHREAAETLDKVESLLLPAYMSRFKGSEDELKALLQEDKLLTAEECLKYGFCDQVVDDIKAVAEFDVDMLPEAARAMFKQGQEVMSPPASALSVQQITEVAAEFGLQAYAADFALRDDVKDAEALRKVCAEAREINLLCSMLGVSDQAAGHIKGRKTYADVKQALADARAAETEATHVDSASSAAVHKGKGDGRPVLNSAAIWKEIHAMKATQ